ncbi:hypothetical protein ACHAWF_015193 [Thalassiosira exigua]
MRGVVAAPPRGRPPSASAAAWSSLFLLLLSSAISPRGAGAFSAQAPIPGARPAATAVPAPPDSSGNPPGERAGDGDDDGGGSDDAALRRMQSLHRPVASSFAPSEFDPHPALDNRHLQTIAGVYLRKDPDCAYVSDSGFGGLARVLGATANLLRADAKEARAFWDERVRVESSCERDFYTVDVKYAGERRARYHSAEGEGLVILIHGLESNSNASLSTDLARSYADQGFDVACINFRGCCGSGPNDTLGGYHLGFTDDLRHFLSLVKELYETDVGLEKRPIYLSGFSLGANVVVKCLGELGESALILYNVHGAAVTGAPFDGERNAKYIDAPGFNRAVYAGNFLKTMKKRARRQLDAFCDGDPSTPLFDFPGAMTATSVGEFENAFIARVYGFEDNVDYYRSTSCYYYLPGVAVPLLIVNAGDDPFFDPDFFPVEEGVDGGGLAPIKMVRTGRGGHLGYMFHRWNSDDGALDQPNGTGRSPGVHVSPLEQRRWCT